MLTCFTRQGAGAAALALLLAACGGGGGDAAPSTPGPPATPGTPTTPTTPGGPALRFNPATVSATTDAGVSTAISINATALRAAEITGNVFALVVDSTGVILPDVRLLANSATDYSVVLQTSPSLAPGNHKGNLTVQLCRDTACAAQWPGSPAQLQVRRLRQGAAAPEDGCLGRWHDADRPDGRSADEHYRGRSLRPVLPPPGRVAHAMVASATWLT